jgi:RNA polymerase sigma-70 factor (ECF subfamily)
MAFPVFEQSLAAVKAPAAPTAPTAAADLAAQRLSAAVALGDETAFRELYDRYRGRLFRFALVLARGDETLVQDSVQNAFVTAAAKLRKVESEDHLWNWLARVARQHLSKAWRQRQREPAAMADAALPDFPAPPEPDPMLEQHLDAALLAMDAGDRQVIEWFYFEHLSHKQIGERLRATPKAVSSRLERARARLRSWLTRKISHES